MNRNHKMDWLITFAVALATIIGQAKASNETNPLYGTWEAIEYGGSNQPPQDTKTTVTFGTNGICTWSHVFLQTNRITCSGHFAVDRGMLTFEKDRNHIARFSLTYSNECIIIRADEKDWDSWMKLKKKH